MMRRKDREVTDPAEQLKIIETCKVCRIGLNDQGEVYIVPMNFGYILDNNQLVLYFHCANKGRLLQIIAENNRVCVEMDCDHQLLPGDIACRYGFAYASLIGSGQAEIVGDIHEKITALTVLMKHQTGERFQMDEKMANMITIIKVTVEEFSCKRR